MKSNSRFFSRCRSLAQKLVLVLAAIAPAIVGAQNLIKNPNFEDPLGPDNWTVGYAAVTGGGVNQPTNCGPNDFLVAGRCSMANKDLVPGTWDGDPYYWDKHGGQFTPNHDWLMHAYFRQVVTGLVANASYVISAWMGFFSNNDNYTNKVDIYLEALGGPNGQVSKVTPKAINSVFNNPYNWQKYSTTNTASLTGQIEVRLHFNKYGTTVNWEWRNFNAFYDHVSVIRYNTTVTQPSFQILSMTRSNQDINLTWQSVRNNKYRIQWSPSLTPPVWSWVQWSPYLDTYLYANGSSLSFKTNLVSLFSYDPSFDPNTARFFRVRGEAVQW